MKDNYDFSKGKKNPYADKLKGKYAVTVHYDFSSTSTDKNETGEEFVVAESNSKKQA